MARSTTPVTTTTSEDLIITPPIRRRLFSLLVLLLTAIGLVAASPEAALAAPGTLTIGSDGFARFDVAPDSGATEVWIEFEAPGLTAADVVVRLNGVDQTVTTTALGAIAIVPASTSTQSFAIAPLTDAEPDIAATVLDGSGSVLSSASYRIEMVDYRTLPQSAPLAPGGPPGLLAATSLSFQIYLILCVLGGLATIVGVALVLRKNKKVQL